MRSSGRGAEHVDLDHLDWVEDAPRRARSGADRRAAERRSAAGSAPARERRSTDRRSSERRAPAGGETERRARAPEEQPRRRTTSRRAARPPATVLGPGVAERRALMLVTFLLVVYGLVMAYSASSAQAYFEHGSSFYMFGRQVVVGVPRRGRHVRALPRGLRVVPQGRRPARGACLRRSRSSSSCPVSAASSTAPAAGSTSAARACSPASSPSSPPSCSWRR